MADQEAAQAAKAAHDSGMWGAIGLLGTGLLGVLGKVLFIDRRKHKAPQGPSLHEQLGELKDLLGSMREERAEQLGRIEGSMVTKSDLLENAKDLGTKIESAVAGAHKRIDDHLRDHSTQAA